MDFMLQAWIGFPTNLRQFVASSAVDAKLDIRTSFFDQLVQTVEFFRPSDPADRDFSMPPLPWATCNVFAIAKKRNHATVKRKPYNFSNTNLTPTLEPKRL